MSIEPRDPATVENRTNTGVLAPDLRNAAAQMSSRPSSATNVPWAPAPRACTTRSGMRSWSKCMIRSLRWKSSSRLGPRSPAVSELSASSTRTPCAVVRWSPDCAQRGRTASPIGLPAGRGSVTPAARRSSARATAAAGVARRGDAAGRSWGAALVASSRFGDLAPSASGSSGPAFFARVVVERFDVAAMRPSRDPGPGTDQRSVTHSAPAPNTGPVPCSDAPAE